MKMKHITSLLTAFAVIAIAVLSSCGKDDDAVPRGDAFMTSFSIGSVNGTIDEAAKTVSISLAPGSDLSSQIPTITVSSGAKVSPSSGEAQDFSNPVVYTVTDRSGKVESAYTVTATSEALRKVLMIATVAENTDAAWDALGSFGGGEFPEDDKAATAWYRDVIAVDPVFDASYMSFEDASVATNLSDFDMIWVQYAGGTYTGRLKEFPHSAPEGDGTRHSILKETGFDWTRDDATDQALEDAFKAKMKEYYDAGGNLLLGNFAAALADQIGVNNTATNFWEWRPNNDFGRIPGDGYEGDTGPWTMGWWTTDPAYNDLINGITLDNGSIALLGDGSQKLNRTFMWNLTADWATWPWAPNGTESVEDRIANFKSGLNCEILLSKDDGHEVHGVIYNSTGGKGTVISYVSGLYDWNVGSTAPNSNADMKTLTRNSMLFLADLNQ